MTWQFGAFTLLLAGLGAGFWWYERTRPDSRLVALVASLAALGALGRIAFAAVPNVKPTTDIVLVSGYALGGAPGFMIGALSALTSNFFFGQGPWTPWQMAGWGVTGIIGAGLARVSRGRIGRWQLAAVAFVVGFLFTALGDFGDWVTYSDHSLAQLAVYVGKGVGFDLVHATGCLVFALAFGPALNQSLRRFQRRLKGTWDADEDGEPQAGRGAQPATAFTSARRRQGTVLLLVALTLSGILTTSRPGSVAHAAQTPSAAATLSYLQTAQQQDGGFGFTPRQSPDTMVSGWVAIALGADPQAGTQAKLRLVHYLDTTIQHELGPGSVERTVLALEALGQPVKDVDGVPLLAHLQDEFSRDGSVREQTNLTSFAVLALRAADRAVPPRTLRWLVAQQDGDGGFNFSTGGAHAISDPDDTGAALQALAGSGHQAVERRAVQYLRSQQNRDGGFPSEPGGYSNAQSTAFAVQGLVAAGIDPGAFHQARGVSATAYLKSLTASDGELAYSRGTVQTPVWVSAQALPALLGRALPIHGHAPSVSAGIFPVATAHTAGRLLLSLQSLL